MEFRFSINNVLRAEITKVDHNLKPFHSNVHHTGSGQSYRIQLSEIIDEMGLASAKAQGLGGAITSASKLANSSHHLYIMKDENGPTGSGAVVGILKVGHKKLFIYWEHGKQFEMEPLCVLDFYVHESKQRLGCGKKLFEFMLKEEGARPVHMAIDRPSSKFSNFLSRHYGLKDVIPQVNNFVVFNGFFSNQPAESFANRRRVPTDSWQHPLDPVGRPKDRPKDSINNEAAGHSGEAPVWERRHGCDTLLAWGGPAAGTEPGKEVLKTEISRSVESTVRNEQATSSVTINGSDGLEQSVPTSTEHERSPSPPLLRRDGPSEEYMALNNGLSEYKYTDRRGHLVVAADETSPLKEKPSLNPANSKGFLGNRRSSPSWRGVGIPRHTASGRGNAHTRLW